MIIFDFSRLTRPYRLKRCSFQLMHLAAIAEDLGEEVGCLIDDTHLDQHPFMKKVKRLWVRKMPKDIEVYIAKADAFYRDINWAEISKLPGFKVCLCNSDRCFRESSKPFRRHRGHPVQGRSDLYMPVNYTAALYGRSDVVPAAHPVDPRMYRLLDKEGLYYAYLRDDVDAIREPFIENETGIAGFMGNRNPRSTRIGVVEQFPNWADFEWKRSAPSRDFISWMMKRRGCIDMRGNGDKSLRFTEAAMLGRTIVSQRLTSKYYPALVNNHNCVLVDAWSDLHGRYDNAGGSWGWWLELAKQATEDYKSGWSLRAQMNTILLKARQ